MIFARWLTQIVEAAILIFLVAVDEHNVQNLNFDDL